MTDGSKIMVAIPTYRRPESIELLLDLAVSQGWANKTSIFVLDNDTQQSAASIQAHPALESGSYVLVPEPGVAAVRNAALERAVLQDFDSLIFLDDDMRPEPDWFDTLVAAGSSFNADLVLGRIVQPAEVLSRHHARAALNRGIRSATGPYEGDVSSGNLLINGNFLRNSGLRFDPRFGGLGGEDTYFGRLAVRHGARLVYCREAVAMECNPVSGTTRTALLRRAFNNGRSLTEVDRSLEIGERLAYRLLRWVMATGFYSTKVARSAFFGQPEELWRNIYALARNLGQLYGRSPRQGMHYVGIHHPDGPNTARSTRR